MKRFSIATFFVLSCWASSLPAATYDIDLDHSSVGFKIRHLIGNVRGSFQKFAGAFDYEVGKPDKWKVSATIETASIFTNVEGRDKHLRSGDFFDVENPKHPEYKTIKFVSTKIAGVKGETAKIHGNLTIKGITKPVILDMTVGGVIKDPWGNEKAGFTATTKVNRKDFGLTWNKALETGGVMVGDEVTITLEIEGQLKK